MLAMKHCAILLAACLFAGSASALQPVPPIVTRLSLTYEPRETLLNAHQKSLIDTHLEAMNKCGGWPALSEAWIAYRLSTASLPRKDYQRIGERMADLEHYLRGRYGLPRVRAFIEVGERIGEPDLEASPFGEGKPDHQVEVGFMCHR